MAKAYSAKENASESGNHACKPLVMSRYTWLLNWHLEGKSASECRRLFPAIRKPQLCGHAWVTAAVLPPAEVTSRVFLGRVIHLEATQVQNLTADGFCHVIILCHASKVRRGYNFAGRFEWICFETTSFCQPLEDEEEMNEYASRTSELEGVPFML